ncbi:hypothetical protein JXQ70_17775 [bacterium]|nr:hypothetical protein [bacterium]
MTQAQNVFESEHKPLNMFLRLRHTLKHGRLLLIGTSFPSHIEHVLSCLEQVLPRENIKLLISDKLVPRIALQLDDLDYTALPAWGPLSFKWTWTLVRELRQQRFEHVLLLYHDPERRGNRRAECLSLCCADHIIMGHSVQGDLHQFTRSTFVRNFVVKTQFESSLGRFFFLLYLFGVRIRAMFDRTGRRLLWPR